VEAARAAAGDAVVEAHRVAESKLDAGVTREEAAAMREEVMLFRGVNIELLSLEDLEVLEKEQGNRLANVQEVRAMKLRTSIQHLRTGKDVQGRPFPMRTSSVGGAPTPATIESLKRDWQRSSETKLEGTAVSKQKQERWVGNFH
ncbi:hypothetical protein CYMTET_36115, partial [Cymbomonas tetramitiformis]